MSATYTELLTAAHRSGDEVEVNRLLDVRASVKEEITERIGAANDAAANLAHQLKQLGLLIDSAKEQDMCIEDGDAPLLKIGVATNAIQDWISR